ncbi:transcription termination factor 2 isoform X1 [Varanus komodoensis]|uniref:transcription termination factor 2 isoform X1 n=1 Tax=Varanus komodoensis TaxID=61221 RepID=UPI001CF7728B|nr:transcription termination factor 2 isoform X1 [Varanus komodoensis]
MEKVLCDGHGHPCFLKTGIRDGPNKGKSFYVCGVQGQKPCEFVRSTELCPSHCLMHEEYIVDLQVLMKQQETDTYKLFYRCSKGKMGGKRWCGSVPWQDSKATRPLSKPQPTLELHHVNQDQRNPFKVPAKNHETLSVEPMNGGRDNHAGEKDSEKREGEDSAKKDQLVSVSSELPAALKIKNKQPEEKNERSRREAVETQTKLSKATTEKQNNPSLDACKYSFSKKPERPLNHTGQDSAMRSTEAGLPKAEEPKQLLPGVSSQASNTRPINEEQHQKGGSGAHNDKTATVKTSGSKGADEKGLIPKESVTIPDLKSFPKAQPKGNLEKPLTVLQTGIAPKEKNCTNKNVSGEEHRVFVPSKFGQKLHFHQGKDHHQMNLASVPPEMTSMQIAESMDSQVLHRQLSAQLREKQRTLKLVNVQALPDKGERLLKQVHELETALGSLNLEAEGSVKEAGVCMAGSLNSMKNEKMQHDPFNKVTIEEPHHLTGKGPQPFREHHKTSSLEISPPLSLRQNCSSTSKEYSHKQALCAGQIMEDNFQAVYNATTDVINQLHKALESCPTEKTVVQDPPGLKVSLLPHQKQALAWLLWRESQKPCGGILADDMGLGKTLTMISLILVQKPIQKEKKQDIWMSRKDSPVILSDATLIVCPASLIHHWEKEVERHVATGKLKVCLYHGPNRIKNTTVLADYDVVVTTYSILAKEIPTQKEDADMAAKEHTEEDKSFPFSPLRWIHWTRIILDEAHNIKNPKVQTSLAACKLRATARWAVTGTPIQNNLLDMYSLLRFLQCNPFDQFKVWKSQVDNNTRKGGERLAILTRSLLLRRMKNQLDSSGKPLVLLPQRLTRLHTLKLSQDERSVYDVLFTRSRSTLQSYLKRQEAQHTADSGKNPFDKRMQQFTPGQLNSFEKTAKDPPPTSTTIHILSLLLRLRQCCCHLSLLKVALEQANLNSEGISLTLEEQLCALTLSESDSSDPQSVVYLFGTAFSTDLFETTRQSTKLSHLLEELKVIHSHSQKSVIVSQWTSMLKVVAKHLERLGLRYATVDGSVNPKQRMDVVEAFNSTTRGPEVMLISLLAGGVGLNLVGGNHLFLLDMHWNPALEDQACDRIYRVGQQNNVTIHRFVCEDTVEEKISELQTKKKELAQKVLSGQGDSFTKLTLADLKLLFGI